MSELPKLDALEQTAHYPQDLAYYDDCLNWLKQRLALAVSHFRSSRSKEHREGFGGLYIGDEEVNEIVMSFVGSQNDEMQWSVASLTAEWQRIEAKKACTGGLKLDHLITLYGLGAPEAFILLLAFLPEIEPRLLKVYAYLHDDVQKKCITPALCRQLYPGDCALGDWYRCLLYHEPLSKVPLLRGSDDNNSPGAAPRLEQAVYCEDGIRNFLLGYHYPDDSLDGLLSIILPGESADDARLSAFTRLQQQQALPHWPVTGLRCDDGPGVVQQLADTLQTPVYWLKSDPHCSWLMLQRWLRDAWLHGVVPVLQLTASAEPASAEKSQGQRGEVMQWLADAGSGFIVLDVVAAIRAGAFAQNWPDGVAWHIDYPPLSIAQQRALWQTQLPEDLWQLEGAEQMLALVSEQFAFNATTITAIATTVAHQLRYLQQQHQPERPGQDLPWPLQQWLLQCRSRASAPMAALATLVSSTFGWEDLVIGPGVQQQLQEVQRNARYSLSYIGDSGMDRVLGATPGTCALFSGASGTGKTMAASVIANVLGLDLYRVDLSRVVSKYIGETEKNLDRIFAAAADSRGILFFDEGDALFGKRSEIKDAHDRYANVEVSYLLQKIELHPGTTIIASNFADNIDEAFIRRFEHIVAFAMPGEAQRKGIWQRMGQLSLAMDEDIDFDFLARHFELSGGHIKNCIVSAAFSAREAGTGVAMSQLIAAVAREYRKLKRPVDRSSFGRYYSGITRC